ncbi:MAG: Rrf2 family transcriptional regulator [Gammaproteobacteria bacterium]|nr:Rrf2 family transcriptional regulator [Gammaproteobacteria bacterium]
MQLTRHTDYSLRVLAFLCLKKEGKEGKEGVVTIAEIANYYSISRNHLVKVVHHLSNAGFIITTRGKGGGLRLAQAATDIFIGDVVRKMEPHFDIAECFNSSNQACTIEPMCKLKMALNEACDSFLNVLDKYTLADAIAKKKYKAISNKLPPEAFSAMRQKNITPT